MVTIRLKGHITDDGQLKIDLPKDLHSGEVNVVIEIPESSEQLAAVPTWSDQELEEMMHIEPQSGAQIVAGLGAGWETLQISGAEWVEQLRHRRREQNQW